MRTSWGGDEVFFYIIRRGFSIGGVFGEYKFSPDGKSYAYFTYEGVVFADGVKLPAPLDIVAFQDNGRTVFKWITLENDKDIVVYMRRA